MPIIRRIARPLLAAPLIQNGLDAARHPTPRLENAAPVLDRISQPLRLPRDRVQVIRVAGGISAGAGILLSLGRLPRLSAVALAVTSPLVNPDSPFWAEKDPEARRAQRTALLKNLGLLGGVLLASVDTSGSPDLAWRSRRAARQARRAAASATQAASEVASRTSDSASGSVRSARSSVQRSARRARRRAEKAASAIGA
jgi:uncharacterized membrane protein YphA (DoxX/SURF4 family)